uniref:Uncharacterized protein n=1 Tax=Candidatus Methanogaster sp. ANME-2c ERB4 TaxID=2759911 RepID=A0A7G9YLX9_9EURY|nr:hypothetical protein KNGNHFEO_00009 [Methanosarcinales archaeon ANME-2c ERB4]
MILTNLYAQAATIQKPQPRHTKMNSEASDEKGGVGVIHRIYLIVSQHQMAIHVL